MSQRGMSIGSDGEPPNVALAKSIPPPNTADVIGADVKPPTAPTPSEAEYAVSLWLPTVMISSRPSCVHTMGVDQLSPNSGRGVRQTGSPDRASNASSSERPSFPSSWRMTFPSKTIGDVAAPYQVRGAGSDFRHTSFPVKSCASSPYKPKYRVHALSVRGGRGCRWIAEWVNLLQWARRCILAPQQRAVAPAKCHDDQRAVLEGRHEEVVAPYRWRRVAGGNLHAPQAVGRGAKRGRWPVGLGHASAVRSPETRPLSGRRLLPDEGNGEHAEQEDT